MHKILLVTGNSTVGKLIQCHNIHCTCTIHGYAHKWQTDYFFSSVYIMLQCHDNITRSCGIVCTSLLLVSPTDDVHIDLSIIHDRQLHVSL